MILVGELVPFALAVIALLLLIGAWLLFQPFKRALSKVPVVGGYVVGYVDTFLGVAIQAVEKDLDLMLVATGRLVWALGGKVWGWVYQVTQGIAHAGALASHALAVAYQTAAGIPAQIAGAVSGVLGTVQQWIWNTMGYAQGLVSNALSTVQQWIWNTMGYAQGLVSNALSTVQQWIWNTMNFAQSLFNIAEADIAAVASDVISEANTVLGEAEAAISGAVAGVEAEIQGLAGTIEGEIQGLTGQISGLLPLLGALPLIGAIPGLITEAETCLKPLCDTVTPNAPQLGKLGQFLQGLETLGVDVLVAGLFAEAVTNPAGLAHETVTLVEDVGGPVITGIRDLTGL